MKNTLVFIVPKIEGARPPLAPHALLPDLIRILSFIVQRLRRGEMGPEMGHRAELEKTLTRRGEEQRTPILSALYGLNYPPSSVTVKFAS